MGSEIMGVAANTLASFSTAPPTLLTPASVSPNYEGPNAIAFPFVTAGASGVALDGSMVFFDPIVPVNRHEELKIAGLVVQRGRSRSRSSRKTSSSDNISSDIFGLSSPVSALEAAIHEQHRSADSGYGAVLTAVETVDVILAAPLNEGGDVLLVRGLQGLSLSSVDVAATVVVAARLASDPGFSALETDAATRAAYANLRTSADGEDRMALSFSASAAATGSRYSVPVDNNVNADDSKHHYDATPSVKTRSSWRGGKPES